MQGENLDVPVGEELCGAACSVGSGIVVLKYSAIQCLMFEIKQHRHQQKIRVSLKKIFIYMKISKAFLRAPCHSDMTNSRKRETRAAIHKTINQRTTRFPPEYNF